MSGIFDYGATQEIRSKDLRLTNGSRLIPRPPSIFDHFTGIAAFNSAVPQEWVVTETGSATPFAVTSGGVGGHAIGVTGATTNNAEEIAGKNVCWIPSTMAGNQKLILEVRAKFVGATAAVDGDYVIGFADAVTFTSGLPFVVGTSSLYTTESPVEFAGFHYSSIPTSGTLYAASANYVGIKTNKNSVGAVAVSSGVVKTSSFKIYRIEMDASANAQFYIDDVHVGSVAVATTAATALTPYIGAVAKASHTNTATIDYIFVGGDLV